MVRTMLVSVGGSEAPIVCSIIENRPDKLIFFVSKQSRSQVSEKIIPQIYEQLKIFIDHEFIVTQDEQDIGICTSSLLKNVPVCMKKLGNSEHWANIVDYTGGTKTMSAAMVWASSKYPCSFSYVGASSESSRDKDGMGVVINGMERCIIKENPWNQLAYFEIEGAMDLFNTGQYSNASNIFRNIAEKVSEIGLQRLFSVLTDIVEGYAQWDVFNHIEAQKLIGNNIDALIDMTQSELLFIPDLKPFTESVIENYDFLKAVKHGQLTWIMIHDILANSQRRAILENKFEDAIVRIYAALAKIAQYQLKLRYGIEYDLCDSSRVPDELKSEFRKYKITDEYFQLDIQASYKLLIAFGDIYGKRFESAADIQKYIKTRHRSIFESGMQTNGKETYQSLFCDILNILNCKPEALPVFPKFGGK